MIASSALIINLVVSIAVFMCLIPPDRNFNRFLQLHCSNELRVLLMVLTLGSSALSIAALSQNIN